MLAVVCRLRRSLPRCSHAIKLSSASGACFSVMMMHIISIPRLINIFLKIIRSFACRFRLMNSSHFCFILISRGLFHISRCGRGADNLGRRPPSSSQIELTTTCRNQDNSLIPRFRQPSIIDMIAQPSSKAGISAFVIGIRKYS